MSWPVIALEDLCHTVTKGTTPTSIGYNFASEGIPFLRIQNLKGNSVDLEDVLYIDSSTHQALKRSMIKAGDLLITIAGTIGRTAIVPSHFPDCNCNQAVAIIRFDTEKLLPLYLLYWLNSVDAKSQIAGKKVTATISNLSLGQIKNLKIPLPPLETQKQIAAVLGKADQLRKDCQQMEQELNSLAQSVFIDMFGDPVTNPKGWDIAPLSSLGIVKGGLQVTSKRSVNPISVPYLRVANVYRDYLKLDEVKEIRVTSKELERVLLEKGDVLFVEGHGNANEVGRTAVWNNEIDQCVHQNHLIRFRAGDEVRPEYVSAFVNSASGRRQLVKMSKTTSGLNTLSTSNINSIQITVPPLAQQDKYLSFMSGLLKQKGANSELNTELDDQFNALMQKAFKGDLNL